MRPKGWGLGIPGLGSFGPSRKEMAEEARRAAREELAKEIGSLKKTVSEGSWCWSSKDVAQEFGVHPKTVDRWRRVLGLPSRKIGRSVKFKPRDVRRWSAQRGEG